MSNMLALAERPETRLLERIPRKRSWKRVAGDIMIPEDNYPVISAKATIREAVLELINFYDRQITNCQSVHAIPKSMLVVNGKGEFDGILSVRNLIQAITSSNLGIASRSSEFWACARILATKKVRDIMQQSVAKVKKDTRLSDVIQLMTAYNTRRVIVVDDERDEVIGVVREQELFLAIADTII